MHSPAPTANDKIQEVSLIDLASVFIRFKKVFFLAFSIILLLALIVALVLPEKYQYTTLVQLAEKSSEEPIESSGALVGWLQYSVLPTTETIYRDERSQRMPFQLVIEIPADTMLLKLTSKAEPAEQNDLEQVHQSVTNEVIQRQKNAAERYLKGLKAQLASVNETIELLRAMEDSGAALPDAVERKAEIEQKISFVKEPEAITVAQPSLEPVSRSPLFIVVIGGFLAGVLASIVTLVWALFSHARKRMSAV
ncbi:MULTISPECIES: Wzz/FepE/Etk N-terminal domain-containing protein [unclassified Marinobacter]|jgi:uncharacterized protein involved in exopolysaccharide biosynthesis|uniref:Wzz/FepE/Etk N-terminal domain-containing protein n=1 Tax=unclassified Marinobacter TaxID=83889 RepID=UPI001A11491B|nr:MULTISPECIES: Wzz/FepE/Etk N-terminal domain-containing protein [unclassified Marinobacter]HIO03561.1 hypothetical protein [Alphaproteobacteria bacterium]|tara:strand:- start:3916 stop:4671 length:756 start_codon:yes stop_codon:yes gene_type:complete